MTTGEPETTTIKRLDFLGEFVLPVTRCGAYRLTKKRTSLQTSSSTSEFSLVSSVLDLVRSSRESPKETDNRHATQSDLFVPANTDCAEQSYISSTAFSDLTFSVEDSHESRFPGDVGFRQVSNDPAMPVFFISPPTLMYGYLAPESQRLWQSACSVLGPGAPRRLIEMYVPCPSLFRRESPSLIYLAAKNSAAI